MGRRKAMVLNWWWEAAAGISEEEADQIPVPWCSGLGCKIFRGFSPP